MINLDNYVHIMVNHWYFIFIGTMVTLGTKGSFNILYTVGTHLRFVVFIGEVIFKMC